MYNIPFVQVSVAVVTFMVAFIFRKAFVSKFMVDGKMNLTSNIVTTVLLMGIPWCISLFLVSNFFPTSSISSLFSMLIFLFTTELYFYILTKIEKVNPSGFMAFFTK